jgi:glycosyltransferase involved in cell wall biosynthesis
MNQSQSCRSQILPVSEGIYRPLWSVMIPTYNCAHYLRETLNSVLAQDPGSEHMQIEVIDDCSTLDNPEAVVQEVGEGRVNFYRQPKNLGHIGNFNTCIQRSKGHFIHLLHGDDCVRTGFYQKLQSAFVQNPGVGAAFCRDIAIDEYGHWQWFMNLQKPESGILDDWLRRIAIFNQLNPPSMVVKREVYEKLGGFDTRIQCFAEDWEMWVRIAAHYPVWYEAEPLALYRLHSQSLTARGVLTGQNIRDVRKILEINQEYLPAPIIDKLSSKAKEHWAIYAIKYKANEMLNLGDLDAALIQIEEGLKCSTSAKVIRETIYPSLQLLKRWLKRRLKQAIGLS